MSGRSKRADTVPPNPSDLIESLRDFGYTLPSALADLIDNSLAAQAKNVWLDIEASSPSPHIAVLDDGEGMTEARLIEAMRMGTIGPLSTRAATDLGRFGLGMKTASLSQGRCLTVMSKHGGKLAVRRWDLLHVKRVSDWELLSEPTDVSATYYDKLAKRQHGTAIVIEQLDRASFMGVKASAQPSHLASDLESIRGHLGMVFHRFIDEDAVEIRLGPTSIPSWNPYLPALSTCLAPEILRLASAGQIHVTPFVLPHHSRLDDDQHERAAGPLGWNAHQGFYIYRCRRLIVPGTWLNLKLKKEEHYKLARIQVDLPNTMDHEWQLNVMKSYVSPPSILKDDFRRIATDVRRQASDVYRLRGERQAPSQPRAEHFVWRREETRTGVRFRVDRTHPMLQALLHAGCMHDALLQSTLSLVESTVPVAAMLQEPRKTIDGAVNSRPPVDIDLLVDIALHAEQYFIRTGKTSDDARRLVLSSEPFVRFQEAIVTRLHERTGSVREETIQ